MSIAPPRLDASVLEQICGGGADSVGRVHRHRSARLLRDLALRSGTSLPASRSKTVSRRRAASSFIAGRSPRSQPRRLATSTPPASHTTQKLPATPGAVLVYAPAAAEHAFEVGSFREAAAQYARALRFATDRPPGERAALLEGRSRACYLADDQVEAIAVMSEAIALRKTEGAPAAASPSAFGADVVPPLPRALLPGRSGSRRSRDETLATEEGVSGHRQRVALPSAPDLRQRHRCRQSGSLERPRTIATRHGDLETAAEARVTIGSLEFRRDASTRTETPRRGRGGLPCARSETAGRPSARHSRSDQRVPARPCARERVPPGCPRVLRHPQPRSLANRRARECPQRPSSTRAAWTEAAESAAEAAPRPA